MRRRVVRQHEDRRPAVFDELARHAEEEIGLYAPQAVKILLYPVHGHLGSEGAEIGEPILVAVPNHNVWVFEPVADGLAEHRGGDTAGRSLEQLPGEATANTVAHVKEFA